MLSFPVLLKVLLLHGRLRVDRLYKCWPCCVEIYRIGSSFQEEYLRVIEKKTRLAFRKVYYLEWDVSSL